MFWLSIKNSQINFGRLFKISMTIILLLNSYLSLSQVKDIRTIKGRIVDSLNKRPISYGSIEIKNPNDSTILRQSYSNDDGVFTFNNLQTSSQVVLNIKTIGFEDKDIYLKFDNRKVIDLGEIAIIPKMNLLNTVVIKASQSTINNKIDRLVFTPDSDMLKGVNTALGIVRKAPLLSVGQDGQIFLRGKSDVKILLNGKSVPADVIKGLPSLRIKSIEIFSNSSSKYDAEGTGGIINIITKNKQNNGIEGSLSSTIGTSKVFNESIALAIKQNKLNINASYSINAITTKGSTQLNTIRSSGSQNQTGDITNQQRYQFGILSADYEIDTLNNIGFSINLLRYNFKKKKNANYNTINNGDIYSSLISNNEITRPGGYGDLTYLHHFKHSKDLLSASILQNWLNVNDSFKNTQFLNPYNYTLNDFNTNKENFKETTIQLDYSNQLTKTTLLKFGYKYLNRKNKSSFNYYQDSINNITNNQSDSFQNTQNINALYANLTSSISKFNFQLGLRAERMVMKSNSQSSNLTYDKKYLNLFPSAILSYPLLQEQTLKLSYSERIQRPSISYLNPYVNTIDPYNIKYGNPDLDPEIIHKIQFGYSKNFGKSYLDGTIDYTGNSQIISTISSPLSDKVLSTTFDNTGNAHLYGAGIYFSTPLNKWLSMDISANTEKVTIHNKDFSNKGWNYFFSYNANILMPYDIQASLFVIYQSKQIIIQGTSPENLYNMVQLNKTFFKNKLTTSIVIEDPLLLSGHFDSIITGSGFKQILNNDINLQTFQFKITYLFGKQVLKRHKKIIDNTDLKK